MATVEEIEAATRILRGGRDWATSGPEMVPLTTGKVEAALDAAASVRAEVGIGGMEIIRSVASIEALNEATRRTGITYDHVCTARVIVAAAERKEVMSHDAGTLEVNSWGTEARSSDATTPPTAGPIPEAGALFQARVKPWLIACFGEAIAADPVERNHRFLEEAVELVQSLGCTASEAHQLVDYVYGRPAGDAHQETGGVMVTLAALCLASGLDMHAAGEAELTRIWGAIEKIRAKRAAKPRNSPLPAPSPQPPAPAEGGMDVAGLAAKLKRYANNVHSVGAQYTLTSDDAAKAADALTAQAAEIERLRVKEAGIEAAIAAVEPDARDLIADINARIESGAATEIEADCRDALRAQAAVLARKEAQP